MSDAYERKLNDSMGLDFPNIRLPDDMGGGVFQPRVQTRDFYKKSTTFNLKYPETVGEDFNTVTNYNSNASSHYAKSRIADKGRQGPDDEPGILKDSMEPFVFFEFMEITPKKKLDRLENMGEAGKKARTHSSRKGNAMNFSKAAGGGNTDPNDLEFQGTYYSLLQDYMPDSVTGDSNPHQGSTMLEAAGEAGKGGWFTAALRQYAGSIALYMPTDIQINDQIVYNEATRKVAGILEGGMADLSGESAGTVATSQASMTALGTGVGALSEKYIPKLLGKAFPKATEFIADKGKVLGGFLGAAGASIVSDEYQRSTGKATNPHDYMAYQSTGLRSFTFTFTFLPDSKDESDQVTKIIKQFRVAAHAKRNDSLTLTVPDHVVTSFHGAGDMIQMPPTVIEAVNITYNPNNTSFFKDGNNPVEVAMSITLKEIVPLYRHDIEGGF